MKHFKILVAAALLALSLSGCIPILAGGVGWLIGVQMAETHAHDEWCAQHIDVVACHP
jgi:hypothetical protein